jgi:hypothetical protein
VGRDEVAELNEVLSEEPTAITSVGWKRVRGAVARIARLMPGYLRTFQRLNLARWH